MSDEIELSGADRELVEALGSLRPAGGKDLSARLLFEAGRKRGRSERVVAARVAMAAAAVLLVSLGATWLAWPDGLQVASTDAMDLPTPIPRENPPAPARPMYARTGAPTVASEPLPDNAYINMRREVLEKGLDALPEGAGGAATVTLRDWIHTQNRDR